MPLVAAACLLLAGCSSGKPVVTVDQAVTLADQQIHLKVTGLPAHKPVTVGAEAVDASGVKWHSEATFTTDGDGGLDLDSAKPSGGSYQGVDGMGLFWSMNPPAGDPGLRGYVPPTENGRPVQHLEVFVSRAGQRLASTAVTRSFVSADVTTKRLTMASDKLVGMYFAPAPSNAKHPAVLLLGGSEGGLPATVPAALLASHGYPVLALAYFHAAGLPNDLRNIPIEYFASAARWLAEQSRVAPGRLAVLGTSYGSEAALLLADHFPDLIHGAVLCAPGASATNSYPKDDGYAWTYQGKPVEVGPIPVDRVSGPVLAIAGGADLVWESRLSAQGILRELDDAHDKYPHEAVIVPNAGHGVSGVPYLSIGTHGVHPVSGQPIDLGGTRAANDLALRQGWAKTLALLATVS